MRLAFKIAVRFLSSSKGQTVMIAFGIAIGISVQIFIGSLIEGLQDSLVDATIGSASHITVKAAERGDRIPDYATVSRGLQDRYPAITVISPTLTLNGFMVFADSFDRILLRGFDLNESAGIYKFANALLPGSDMPGKGEVILGRALAENNGIAVGDTVTLISPDRNSVEARVSGLFDLKVAAINESWAVGSMELVSLVFELPPGEATAVEMQIADPFNADTLTREMAAALPASTFRVSNWKEANQQLLSGLSGQSTSSLMIQVFVVISVVLGIASVLAITVLQKSRQIGILKAMGIDDGASSLVFLFQGFLLGVIGGLLGIFLGLGLLWSFGTFALNPDGTPVVPIVINPLRIMVSGLIAVVASTAASIIPALTSRRLSPIEVIRNG